MKLHFPALLSSLMVGAVYAQETATPSAPEKKPDAKSAVIAPAEVPATPAPATAAPRTKNTSLDALFKLVPIGRTHEGVRYPVMEKGTLSSMVTSERMTRLDENSLQFEEAVIDQRGDEPLTFHLERATYNRASDLLLSSQPSRIESKTYQIEGDSMSYDRKSSVARMDGRVRMIIFDTDSMRKSESPASAAPAPATGSPANPPTGEKTETKANPDPAGAPTTVKPGK